MKKKSEINVRLCTVMDTCISYFGNNPNIVQMQSDGYYAKTCLLEHCKNIKIDVLFGGAMKNRMEHGIIVIGDGLFFIPEKKAFATYVLWDDRNGKFSIVEWTKDYCKWVRYKGKQLNDFQQFGLESCHQTVLFHGMPTKGE